MRKRRRATVLLVTTVAAAAATRNIGAYEITTHSKLTCLALRSQGDLTRRIQSVFDLQAGLDSEIATRNAAGQTLIQSPLRAWSMRGSEEEDNSTRPLHHFHDPLAVSISSAGLFHENRSSISWILAPAGQQSSYQYYSMSWSDARAYYLRALTERAIDEREKYLAFTFKALGHIMHLVQDASVPSHVRDDAHLPLGGQADYFHFWVDRQARLMMPVDGCDVSDPAWSGGIWANMAAIAPSEELLLHPRADELLPLASLIDADRYDGTNADSVTVNSATALGIAEYSNANFFSQDTIEIDYPEPRIDRSQWAGNAGLAFFWLTRLGVDIVRPLAFREFRTVRPGVWFASAPSLSDTFGEIPRAYATKLLPRAIGYSAEVPKYFFRDRIDARTTDKDTIRIVNHGNEPLDGTFTLLYDNDSGARLELAAWSLQIGVNGESDEIQFPIPTDAAEPGKYVLVFSGTLGLESGAVASAAGKWGCLPEETWNGSSCHDACYDVRELTFAGGTDTVFAYALDGDGSVLGNWVNDGAVTLIWSPSGIASYDFELPGSPHGPGWDAIGFAFLDLRNGRAVGSVNYTMRDHDVCGVYPCWQTHAVIQSSGVVSVLPDPPSIDRSLPAVPVYTVATRINAVGDIAGYAQVGVSNLSASVVERAIVLWLAGGTPLKLPTNGAHALQPDDINDNGTVLGKLCVSGWNDFYGDCDVSGARTALWNGSSGPHIIEGLWGLALNNRDQVIGFFDGSYLAAQWSPGATRATALPAEPNWEFSSANAINNAGVIVGDSPAGGVLWTPDGRIVNLSQSIESAQFNVQSAVAINDAGQILAYCNTGPCVLTPCD